jgi:hypothetical protein
MTERGLKYNQGFIEESTSTVISLVPFPIDEVKPGLIPGQFHIDASDGKTPVCLSIGDSFFYVYIDAERGNLRVPAPSYQVAKSICFDYLGAQIEAREECHPALFWKQGRWTPERALKELSEEIEYFSRVQHTWFEELVKRADDDWEKTRAHYAISDIQRHALRVIDPANYQRRPWVIARPEENKITTTLCPTCGSDVPSMAVVCKYCRFILKPDQYNASLFQQQPGGQAPFDPMKGIM